jgi:hypothetical protein
MHFDNSGKNPENPDPTKTVIWGQQSFDEMMVCFFNVAFPADLSARELLPLPTADTALAEKHQKIGSSCGVGLQRTLRIVQTHRWSKAPLLQRFGGGLRTHSIVIAAVAGDADRPHDLVIGDQGDAAPQLESPPAHAAHANRHRRQQRRHRILWLDT